jgi:hypothetical protein
VSDYGRTLVWQNSKMCYEPIDRVLDGLHAKLAGT